MVATGTTGKPKGCLLNHRGIYWAINAICEYPREVSSPDTDKRLAMAGACALSPIYLETDNPNLQRPRSMYIYRRYLRFGVWEFA